ncbi:NAD(P)H-hydrate epimerase [Candidatus Pacearchaeota archaeon]|nr:NAD(P)H-hydrate epimerase [Candidatus Pacearchaeota archaeon]
MRYLTREEIASLDDLVINKYGIQTEKLMENAGSSVARFVKGFDPRKVIILYGKGNNGGDGLVAARHLSSYGVNVKIIPASDDLNETSKKEMEILRKIGVIPEKDFNCESGNIIVDALLGYNLQGVPREEFALLIDRANSMKKIKNVKIISVDIPSGIDSQTGERFNPCIEADYVLALGMPKKGTKDFNQYLANIGIPKKIYEELGIKESYFREDDVVKII